VKDYGPKDLFYKINYEGTKNIVETSKNYDIKLFVYLSHIQYESKNDLSLYTKTKLLSEKYLLNKYKTNNFPVTIIRPGNVYGPGATTWVERPLESIRKNKIALIEEGKGIFLHTYIDNLIDALTSVINNNIVGEIINITDGSNTDTWGDYLNRLSKMCGKGEIKRNFSKRQALMIAKTMMLLYKIFRIKPLITPMAVNVFTNTKKVDITKAKELLDYTPKISYEKAISNIEQWLKKENYI
jgi:nucleoside-diphosphate-sugar epimerase